MASFNISGIDIDIILNIEPLDILYIKVSLCQYSIHNHNHNHNHGHNHNNNKIDNNKIDDDGGDNSDNNNKNNKYNDGHDKLYD